MPRSVIERTNHLRKLANLKYGPGALSLPPEITRIHMQLTGKGPALKFRRECLPRMKYHNPSVPIIVNLARNYTGAERLRVYVRPIGKEASGLGVPMLQPPSSRTGLSAAAPAVGDERVISIEVEGQPIRGILDALMAETGAVEVVNSAEDVAEMRAVQEMIARGKADAVAVQRVKEVKRKQDELLVKARLAGGMSEEDAKA